MHSASTFWCTLARAKRLGRFHWSWPALGLGQLPRGSPRWPVALRRPPAPRHGRWRCRRPQRRSSLCDRTSPQGAQSRASRQGGLFSSCKRQRASERCSRAACTLDAGHQDLGAADNAGCSKHCRCTRALAEAAVALRHGSSSSSSSSRQCHRRAGRQVGRRSHLKLADEEISGKAC